MNHMKVVSIVGARPQFVKAAVVSKVLRAGGDREVLVHTGQHYDSNMSEVFFEELSLPEPDVNLEIGSGSHGAQTGAMLQRLEDVLLAESPDWALIYGDTNSTLAGAVAAAKLRIPVAHVEAGLRSFNRAMPEEINRVVADHVSNLLLCPSQTAVDNLAAEGVTRGVHLVGDVMYDAVLQFAQLADRRSTVLGELGLEPQRYLLATVHRAENTDDPARLLAILKAFARLRERIVFPIHPRTRRALGLDAEGRSLTREGSSLVAVAENVLMIEPVGYLDMLMLEKNARVILTDSGGIQKEAYWLEVPCVTLRDETEWVETVSAGWNVLAGADPERIVNAVERACGGNRDGARLYGDGRASELCVRALKEYGSELVGIEGATPFQRELK